MISPHCVCLRRLVVSSSVLLLALLLGAGCSSSNAANNDGEDDVMEQVNNDAGEADADTASEPTGVRVATFNASLYRNEQGQLVDDLEGGGDAQAQSVAEVIQRVRPDVVLVNEFDWDADGAAARIFGEEYLAQGQNGAEAIEYEYRYVPETNTGVHSGVDLDGNGQAVSEPGSQSYGNDAFGFGTFPGQYGMVVYSKFPILEEDIRSFQTFLWKDMPDNLLPTDFYSDAAVDVFRLSSKNHVDIPVDVDGTAVHILASHPTPPSFDGPEDRNGRRNHDEIRFWNDYTAGGDQAAYIRDDAGGQGGLESDANFVIVGDLNSDPRDGGSIHAGIGDLLGSERVTDPEPASQGAEIAAERDGQANQTHQTPDSHDTANFSDGRVGNLRVDYALPSANLEVTETGVFWPAPDEEFSALVDVSDHRLVWVDLSVR